VESEVWSRIDGIEDQIHFDDVEALFYNPGNICRDNDALSFVRDSIREYKMGLMLTKWS